MIRSNKAKVERKTKKRKELSSHFFSLDMIQKGVNLSEKLRIIRTLTMQRKTQTLLMELGHK
jgi:hypothetical protein